MRAVPPAALALSPADGIFAPIERLSDRRRHTQTVGRALGRNSMTRDIAQRIGNCSLRLALALEQQDDGNARALITSGRFCQARLCPICEWRRARAWRGRIAAGLQRFAAEHPSHRAIFATFTVRNCPIHETGQTVRHLHAGFRAMTRAKFWPSPYWLRRTEVTIGNPSFSDDLPRAPQPIGRPQGDAFSVGSSVPGSLQGDPKSQDPKISRARVKRSTEDGSSHVGRAPAVASPYGLWAHPHVHSLILVPARYFGPDYVRQAQWQTEWATALGIDYAPVVDVRPARAKDGREALADAAQDAVMEAAKYITKANQIAKLGDAAAEMHMQLKGQRMIQLSQRLSKFIRSGDIQPEEMLDLQEVEASRNPLLHVAVQWDSLLSTYTIGP